MMKKLALFLLSSLIIFAGLNTWLTSKDQCLLNEPDPQKTGARWGHVYLEHAYNPFATGTRKVCLQHAVIAFSDVLTDYPTDTAALMNRANAYVGLQQYEKAVQDYLIIYAQDPAYIPVLEDLYSTYTQMGYTEKTREMLQMLVSALENSDSIWVSLYPDKITKYKKLLANAQP